MVRSANDVVVLRIPSWWNFRHTAWLLGLTAGLLLLVLVWFAVLSKRWRNQIAVFRQRLQRSAVLEERNRIAREIHDTVEQELAGITMQLDLAADCFEQAPDLAREAVDTARQMSRHSMLDARRSVWDLRCHLEEQGDLVSAMTQTLRPLAPQEQVHFEIAVHYVLGHASKFLYPGAVRIASDEPAGTDIKDVAFINVDGTVVLYALNAGADSLQLAVRIHKKQMYTVIPGGAPATLVWK